ncbi:MAG: hypothetical protein ACI9ZV_000911, partial [Candidatus Azotimanducaceae bacterium]
LCAPAPLRENDRACFTKYDAWQYSQFIGETVDHALKIIFNAL